MIFITEADVNDASLIADLGKKTFVESHGSSAPSGDIEAYINEKYSGEAIHAELSEAKNIYHLLYYDGQPAGYSKITLNIPCPGSEQKKLSKLERLYILKGFYDLKAGYELFKFNVKLSKGQGQKGMWLYTWKENTRAINFYSKNGFRIIGEYDFPLSATHSNPNYQLLLLY